MCEKKKNSGKFLKFFLVPCTILSTWHKFFYRILLTHLWQSYQCSYFPEEETEAQGGQFAHDHTTS